MAALVLVPEIFALVKSVRVSVSEARTPACIHGLSHTLYDSTLLIFLLPDPIMTPCSSLYPMEAEYLDLPELPFNDRW